METLRNRDSQGGDSRELTASCCLCCSLSTLSAASRACSSWTWASNACTFSCECVRSVLALPSLLSATNIRLQMGADALRVRACGVEPMLHSANPQHRSGGWISVRDAFRNARHSWKL